MHFTVKPPKYGKLSTTHLSKGERAGLREHGVSEAEFDRMDETSQREWKEELELDSYQDMRKFKG